MSAEANETRIFAGIDEAGLGPLLGPLTLGYSAFRAPLGTRTFWQRLSGIVTRKPRRNETRIVVADSKQVFTRNEQGERRLERTVLSFLEAGSERAARPRDGHALLTMTPESFRSSEPLAPWFERLPERLPVWFDEGLLEISGFRLRKAMEKQSMALVDAGVRAVPAAELNESYRRTHNKGTTVWEKVSPLVRHLWDTFAHEGLLLIVDRQGGRMHYGRQLENLIPAATVDVRSETPEYSEYFVNEPGSERRMKVSFAQRGEDRSFAVALASCLAKYTRELSMRAFNDYFSALQDDLKPTAGYTTDGRRWLADAQPALARAELDPDLLIRQR